MARKVKILGMQISPEIGDKVKNYQKISKLFKQYSWFKPDLVILPELFNIGVDFKKFESLAEPIPNDATTMFLSGIAEQYNTNIVGGSFVEKTPEEKLKNSSIVVNRAGRVIGKYQKIHMFSHYGSNEGKYISPGEGLSVIDTDFGKIGLSICYDLRFPEMHRALTNAGAEIIVCPAAWPYPRYDHWMTLCKARAIENQVFFVGVNQCGKVSLSRTNLGNSMIINPWGEIVASVGSDEGVFMTEIDLDTLSHLRKDFPVLDDINLEAYKLST